MEKGTTNNPNGRPKGATNRITARVREVLACIMAEEIEKVPGLLKMLSAYDQLNVIAKLIPYVVPRLHSTVSSSDSEDQPNVPPVGGV